MDPAEAHTETDAEAEAPAAPREGFWTRTSRRLLYLFAPLVLSAAALGVLYLATSKQYAAAVLAAGLLSLFGAGTTVIFATTIVPLDWIPGLGELEFKLPPWEIAFVVMWVNAISAWWYVYNIDLFERLPKLGPYLRNARRNAVATLKDRPWIRRWATVGVGLFVVTPLPGSGALGGALMGRIIGVSRRATWLSVALAGIIVSVGYAYAATSLGKTLDAGNVHPGVRIGGLVLVFVMIWFMLKLLRKFGAAPPPVVDDAGEIERTAEVFDDESSGTSETGA